MNYQFFNFFGFYTAYRLRKGQRTENIGNAAENHGRSRNAANQYFWLIFSYYHLIISHIRRRTLSSKNIAFGKFNLAKKYFMLPPSLLSS